MNDIFVIKQPWITEKSAILSEAGKYVFIVKPSATKNEVRKAVKDLYKVDAVDVNMINRPNKSKRFRGLRRTESGYRKAIVTLKEGQKIDLGR